MTIMATAPSPAGDDVQRQRSPWWLWALPACMVWLAITVAAGRLQGGPFAGLDSYMRLVRLRGIIERGGWNGGWLPSDGAPYGYALHWTMPLDLLTLLLAAPLAPFLGWQDAVVMAAPAVGPVTGMLAIAAVAWALAPLRQQDAGVAAATLVATSPMLAGYGLWGRVDHHVLIVAGAVWTLGALARCILRPSGASGALLAAAGGLTLWVSLEGLPVVASAFACAGLLAAWRPERYRPAVPAFALVLPATFAAALLLDPPHAPVEPDRLSLPHLALALAVVPALLLPLAPPLRQRPRLRLTLAVTAAALAGALVAAIFPAMLNPLGINDPEVLAFVLERTDELKAVKEASQFFLRLTTPVIGLAALAWLAVREWPRQAGYILALAAVALLAYTVQGFLHARVAVAASVFGAIACGIAWGRLVPMLKAPARMALFAALLVMPAGLGLATRAPAENADEEKSCDIPAVLPSLRAAVGEGRSIILSDLNLAPPLLYHTDYRTVGSMYHRNEAGLRDTIATFDRPADSGAGLEVVRRRGVDWLLICAKTAPEGEGDGSLHARLLRDDPPGWLRPVPLHTTDPEEPTGLKLYRVTLPARALQARDQKGS